MTRDKFTPSAELKKLADRHGKLIVKRFFLQRRINAGFEDGAEELYNLDCSIDSIMEDIVAGTIAEKKAQGGK